MILLSDNKVAEHKAFLLQTERLLKTWCMLAKTFICVILLKMLQRTVVILEEGRYIYAHLASGALLVAVKQKPYV